MPSAYEESALREIALWKDPPQTWVGTAVRVLSWPLDKAGDAVMAVPGVGWVLHKSIGGLVTLTNDAARWSVRHEAVFADYRKAGYAVTRHGDVHALDLEHVDRSIGWLGTKYKGLTLTEGAALGALGLPGIPADIVALVALNLRAVAEYATYCGFDVASQQEGLFAMHVLGLASSPTDASKAVAMAQLVKITQDVAHKQTWKELQQHAFVEVLQKLAKALGIRLTKAKLAQAIPYIGALVGGGFNAYFTNKVCDAAYFLYRERFLSRKYGPDWVAGSTPPAPDHDPRYPEDTEEIPPDEPEPPSP